MRGPTGRRATTGGLVLAYFVLIGVAVATVLGIAALGTCLVGVVARPLLMTATSAINLRGRVRPLCRQTASPWLRDYRDN